MQLNRDKACYLEEITNSGDGEWPAKEHLCKKGSNSFSGSQNDSETLS